MNKTIRKTLSLSLVLVMFLTFITMVKPIQSNAADYSAWSSIFDPTYYATNYADAASYANGNVDLLWQHFVQVGIPSGRQGSAEFNVYIYAQNYPELTTAFGGNMMQYYIHYAQAGKAEGRNAAYLNNATTPAKQTTTNAATTTTTQRQATTTTTATVTQTTPAPSQATASSCSYVVNTNTGKFHYSSCSSVSQMKNKNKMYTNDSYDTLVKKGYSPCYNCFH